MNPYLNPIGLVLERLYSIARWSEEVDRYVRLNAIDLEALNAHAGILVVTPCTFDNGRFQFHDDGKPAVVIEVLGADAETTIDLAAWPVDTPEAFATALGDADALGIANVDNPATWALGNVLRMHRMPLAWLKAGCGGCCILNNRYVHIWLGKALGPVAVEDIEHGRLLATMLDPRPFPRNQILVPQSALRRAA
jgi:hypothetical protein